MFRYLVRNAAHELGVMVAGRLGFVPVARLEEVEDRARFAVTEATQVADRAVDEREDLKTVLRAAIGHAGSLCFNEGLCLSGPRVGTLFYLTTRDASQAMPFDCAVSTAARLLREES